MHSLRRRDRRVCVSLRSCRLIVIVGLILLEACIYGCSQPSVKSTEVQLLLNGRTMGTTYSIRYRPKRDSPSQHEMQHLIDDELDSVNRQMSTYLKDSEVTRFNDSESTDWIAVSIETAQVVELAQQISIASAGAFDVTVGPLVNLWGFGPNSRRDEVPSDAELEEAKCNVGYHHLEVKLDPPSLKKRLPKLRIDLSAIAKGHGVDRVAKVIETQGLSNYFVEIGGEILTHGVRLDGQPWQVGIEAPLDFKRSIQTVIGLSDLALATSGDYRNFFRRNGQRFSHTIDPKTGKPVTHDLASASVVSETCASADAIATCMMVLGLEQGMRLADEREWAVILMQRDQEKVISTCSARFKELYVEKRESMFGM